jgi:hypothetical protein
LGKPLLLFFCHQFIVEKRTEERRRHGEDCISDDRRGGGQSGKGLQIRGLVGGDVQRCRDYQRFVDVAHGLQLHLDEALRDQVGHGHL